MAKHRSARGAGLVAVGSAAVASVVLGVLVFSSWRSESARREPEPAPPAAPAPPRPAPPTPAVPPAPPALGRAELLEAAAAAASQYVAGATASAPSPIVGRRFRVRLPFGCEGPLPRGQTAGAYWTYGEDQKSIRIVVRPEDWTDSAVVRELGTGADVEAAEGFWMRRPWSLSEDCPAISADPLAPAPAAASPETVGLAVFFEEGGSRAGRRRARPYETTVRVDGAEDPPAPSGFRLLLEGRVVGFRNGRAFRCRSAGPEQRPVCIARVHLESVAVEDPASGEIVARWETGVAAGTPVVPAAGPGA